VPIARSWEVTIERERVLGDARRIWVGRREDEPENGQSSGDDTEKGEPRFFSVLPFINPTVRRAHPNCLAERLMSSSMKSSCDMLRPLAMKPIREVVSFIKFQCDRRVGRRRGTFEHEPVHFGRFANGAPNLNLFDEHEGHLVDAQSTRW